MSCSRLVCALVHCARGEISTRAVCVVAPFVSCLGRWVPPYPANLTECMFVCCALPPSVIVCPVAPIPHCNPNYHNSMSDTEERPTEPHGVIYLGNLPPGLSPGACKHLLSLQSPLLTRTFLQEESSSFRKKRLSFKGNSKTIRYTEGWAEFSTKPEAKRVAALMNGSRLTCKKTSRFYDDLWRIKYLKGFSWDMLAEKQAIERRERESRLRLELQAQRKVDLEFVKSVDESKMFKAMRARKGEVGGGRRLPKQLVPIGDKRRRVVEEEGEMKGEIGNQ